MNGSRAARGALILLLFALAYLLRAREPDLVRFGIDQTSHFEPILYMVRDGEFPLVGHDVSFTPAKLGPFHYYLYAPPMLLSFDPAWSIRWSALLNALTVPLLFLIGRGRFPFAASAAASALFAVHPWLVFVSRELWNLAGLIPITALALLLALEAYDRRSPPLSALALAVAAAATHLHLVAVFPALVLAVALLPRLRAADRPRAGALAAALAALVYAPWLLHQYRHGLEDILAYLTFLTDGAAGSAGAVAPNAQATALLLDYPRFLLHYVGDYGAPLFDSALFHLPARLEQALLLLALVPLAAAAATGRGLARAHARLLLALLFVPLLFLHLFRFELYDRHLLPLFPLPHLMIGLLLAPALAGPPRRAALALALLLPPLACLFLQNFEFTRRIAMTSLVKGEAPLSVKRDVAAETAARLGPVDPFSAEGATHVLAMRDQPSDLRLLMQLLGLLPKEGPPRDLSDEHLLMLRLPDEAAGREDAAAAFLGRVTGEVLHAGGPVRLLALPALIDYDSLECRALDAPIPKWRSFRNPLLELSSRSTLRVRGRFRSPGDGLGAALCIHTNLPLADLTVNGRPVAPLLPYDAQGTTDEVAAAARIFALAPGEVLPVNKFAFTAGPVRRWYGIDLFAVPLREPVRRRLPLLLPEAASTDASPGGFIARGEPSDGAGMLLRSRLDTPGDWAYLRLAPDPPPDFAAFRRVAVELESDGAPGLLRFLAVEACGEEWVLDDYAALAETGRTVRGFPWTRFANPPWAKRTDGRFDPERIRAVALGFHPYKELRGTRETRLLRVDLED